MCKLLFEILPKILRKQLFPLLCNFQNHNRFLISSFEYQYNLTPIVKNLRRDSDTVNAYFINYPDKKILNGIENLF